MAIELYSASDSHCDHKRPVTQHISHIKNTCTVMEVRIIIRSGKRTLAILKISIIRYSISIIVIDYLPKSSSLIVAATVVPAFSDVPVKVTEHV